jgi:hypothetical protein
MLAKMRRSDMSDEQVKNRKAIKVTVSVWFGIAALVVPLTLKAQGNAVKSTTDDSNARPPVTKADLEIARMYVHALGGDVEDCRPGYDRQGERRQREDGERTGAGHGTTVSPSEKRSSGTLRR